MEKALSFSIEVIEFCEKLESQRKYVVANQLLGCGTSIGANVFEAQHAESKADFIHKMSHCLKELRATRRWLRLTQRGPRVMMPAIVDPWLAEAEELIKKFSSSTATVKTRYVTEIRS